MRRKGEAADSSGGSGQQRGWNLLGRSRSEGVLAAASEADLVDGPASGPLAGAGGVGGGSGGYGGYDANGGGSGSLRQGRAGRADTSERSSIETLRSRGAIAGSAVELKA